MDYIQTVLLALVQGVTEFLPISSSAHLILIGRLPGWEDQGLMFDIAVHFGSLMAVLWYFRREITNMGIHLVRYPKRREVSPEIRLTGMLLLATLPIVLAGWMLLVLFNTQFRSVELIAYSTIGFGLLLWFADWYRREQRRASGTHSTEFTISWYQALLIGIAQIFALIPGTSRSGVTITAALLLGISRVAAARFSFLLAIPVICAATLVLLTEASDVSENPAWDVLLLGTVLAGVTAFACIHFFIKLVERIGMLPFVIYRIVLGVGILLIV